MSHTGNEQSTEDTCPLTPPEEEKKYLEEYNRLITLIQKEGGDFAYRGEKLKPAPFEYVKWFYNGWEATDWMNEQYAQLSRIDNLGYVLETSKGLPLSITAYGVKNYIYRSTPSTPPDGITRHTFIKIMEPKEYSRRRFAMRLENLGKLLPTCLKFFGGSNKITFYKNDKRYTRVVQTNKRGTKCVKFEGKLVPVSKLKLKK